MNKNKGERANNLYSIYIVIGSLYVLVKYAFVTAGYLHPGAILHGLIPAVVSMAVGLLALNKFNNPIWNKILVLVPILIFVITPIFMYLKEKSDWLINGRLEVLIIYEIMAIIQFIIALKVLKYNRDKTD